MDLSNKIFRFKFIVRCATEESFILDSPKSIYENAQFQFWSWLDEFLSFISQFSKETPEEIFWKLHQYWKTNIAYDALAVFTEDSGYDGWNVERHEKPLMEFSYPGTYWPHPHSQLELLIDLVNKQIQIENYTYVYLSSLKNEILFMSQDKVLEDCTRVNCKTISIKGFKDLIPIFQVSELLGDSARDVVITTEGLKRVNLGFRIC